jgi:hypothetical protein
MKGDRLIVVLQPSDIERALIEYVSRRHGTLTECVVDYRTNGYKIEPGLALTARVHGRIRGRND